MTGKVFVHVDTGVWVDPMDVSGVEPGSTATIVRVHLRSGAVLAVRIGPDRLCTSVDHVVDRLVDGVRTSVSSRRPYESERL